MFGLTMRQYWGLCISIAAFSAVVSAMAHSLGWTLFNVGVLGFDLYMFQREGDNGSDN